MQRGSGLQASNRTGYPPGTLRNPCSNAEYDGTTWTTRDLSTEDPFRGWDQFTVLQFLAPDDGDRWLAGSYDPHDGNGYSLAFVARWDGSAWSLLDLPKPAWTVASLVRVDGEIWILMTGAANVQATPTVVRVKGDTISDETPDSDAEFKSLSAFGDSSLVLCSDQQVLRWDGSAWSDFASTTGNEMVRCPAFAPSTDRVFSYGDGDGLLYRMQP